MMEEYLKRFNNLIPFDRKTNDYYSYLLTK